VVELEVRRESLVDTKRCYLLLARLHIARARLVMLSGVCCRCRLSSSVTLHGGAYTT